MQSSQSASPDEPLGRLNEVIQPVIRGEKNPSTPWRWITKGIAGLNGERIRLRVWYVGRKPCTTETAVREFIDAVTAARLARIQQRSQHTSEVTDEELASVGLSRKGARQ